MQLANLFFGLSAALLPLGSPEAPSLSTPATRVAPRPSTWAAGPVRAVRAGESNPLQRVVVIGASASAGFMLPSDLGEALDLLMVADHRPVLSLANSRFFTAPDAYAQQQIAIAQANEPTCVIALDFLFWFTYGHVGGDANRARLLERGLAYLESFDCPVLTSTVPDMRAAVGRMLWPGQVPAAQTLAELNLRIEEWALEQPDVVLVSLPEWHAQLVSNEGFEVAGRPWPAVEGAPLLQYDQLHPNADGLALLACKVLESLVVGGVPLESQAFELDPARVAGPVKARLESIVRER